ncbi:hypothetical protein KSP39_PZI019975 [Platanthera zijinensis]|uniref:Retrovirus-related Pol polyprotein from transposon TNT 1-94-like beta-barrel domain-containing protein n=1 Tax=Platanthera zijinensis TaxID=2320716 RepID=A0AAP0B0L7_9ASPA
MRGAILKFHRLDWYESSGGYTAQSLRRNEGVITLRARVCGTGRGLSAWSLLSYECIFDNDSCAPIQDLLFHDNQSSPLVARSSTLAARSSTLAARSSPLAARSSPLAARSARGLLLKSAPWTTLPRDSLLLSRGPLSLPRDLTTGCFYFPLRIVLLPLGLSSPPNCVECSSGLLSLIARTGFSCRCGRLSLTARYGLRPLRFVLWPLLCRVLRLSAATFSNPHGIRFWLWPFLPLVCCHVTAGGSVSGRGQSCRYLLVAATSSLLLTVTFLSLASLLRVPCCCQLQGRIDHSSSSIVSISGGTFSCLAHSSSWILDSWASHHITSRQPSRYLDSVHPKSITVASGDTIPIFGSADIHITPSITLRSVLHVLGSPFNLLSISRLTQDLDCYVTFSSTSCVVQERNTHSIIGKGNLSNGLYILDPSPPMVLSSISSSEWHRHLGHPPLNILRKALPMFPSENSLVCPVFMEKSSVYVLASSHSECCAL